MSATTGEGLDTCARAIARALTGGESLRDTAAISNMRHIALLEQARGESRCAHRRGFARGDTPEEFVLADLQAARARFDEIVGARTATTCCSTSSRGSASASSSSPLITQRIVHSAR